jgi:hypothetical protein
MKTYGPLATTTVVWLTMLSPLIGLVIVILAAQLFGRLERIGSRTAQQIDPRIIAFILRLT